MALSCALRLKSKSRRRAQTFELLVVVADRPSLSQNCKLAADRTNRLQRPWKPIRGSLHKSGIIVRFARTNGELTSHLKAVPSVETKNLLLTFLARNYPLIIYVRQTFV